MKGLLFCLFLIAAALTIAQLVPEKEMKSHLTAARKVAAFYTVSSDSKGEGSRIIVQNQIKAINSSGLLGMLDNVFYATMGKAEESFNISSDKYIHIAHFGQNGSELQTLSLLRQFCHSNPTSKVLYFHDNIHLHYGHPNATVHNDDTTFFDMLNCYALNPNCIHALDAHDTCGWRVSPVPQVHYVGNFWWARCEYVNILVDPMAPLKNQTFVEAANSLNECVGVSPQSFAETWIGTGPILLPADCMNSHFDQTYVWGNQYPQVAAAHCQQPDHHPSACQSAGTFEYVHRFKKSIDHMSTLLPEECRDNRKEVTKLSQILYGEEPHIYLEWLDRTHLLAVLPDGALIRFADSAQVFISEQSELRGIPNLQTFMTLGRDFSEVKVVQPHERIKYAFADMLPSV